MNDQPPTKATSEAYIQANVARARANIRRCVEAGMDENHILVGLLNDEGLATMRTAYERDVAKALEFNGNEPTKERIAGWLMEKEYLTLRAAGLLPFDAELDNRHISGMVSRDVHSIRAHAEWQGNTPDMDQARVYHANHLRKCLHIKGEGTVSQAEVTTALLWSAVPTRSLGDMLADQKASNRARRQSSVQAAKTTPLDTPTR